VKILFLFFFPPSFRCCCCLFLSFSPITIICALAHLCVHKRPPPLFLSWYFLYRSSPILSQRRPGGSVIFFRLICQSFRAPSRPRRFLLYPSSIRIGILFRDFPLPVVADGLGVDSTTSSPPPRILHPLAHLSSHSPSGICLFDLESRYSRFRILPPIPVFFSFFRSSGAPSPVPSPPMFVVTLSEPFCPRLTDSVSQKIVHPKKARVQSDFFSSNLWLKKAYPSSPWPKPPLRSFSGHTTAPSLLMAEEVMDALPSLSGQSSFLFETIDLIFLSFLMR